jgi:hypothetical protein
MFQTEIKFADLYPAFIRKDFLSSLVEFIRMLFSSTASQFPGTSVSSGL